jgi:hypothetical protein
MSHIPYLVATFREGLSHQLAATSRLLVAASIVPRRAQIPTEGGGGCIINVSSGLAGRIRQM